jgi:thymidylate synthase
MPIHYLIRTRILTIYRMHHAARHLYQSRHQAAKSWSERNAAHNEEADLSQVNRAARLVAKAERPSGDNNRSLQSQWVLGAERDGKVNGERIDPLVRLLRNLRGSARARRGHLRALAWGHLCTTLRCGAGRVYRWSFATEAHLTGPRCNGAAAACANATANLVC